MEAHMSDVSFCKRLMKSLGSYFIFEEKTFLSEGSNISLTQQERFYIYVQETFKKDVIEKFQKV